MRPGSRLTQAVLIVLVAIIALSLVLSAFAFPASV